MENVIVAFFAMACEVIALAAVVLFVGIFDSKYYERVYIVNPKVFNWQVALLGAMILSSYWLFVVGNLAALICVQATFNIALITLLLHLSKKYAQIKDQMRYELQRKLASKLGIAAWSLSVSAVYTTFIWFCLFL